MGRKKPLRERGWFNCVCAMFLIIPFFKPIGIEDITLINNIFLAWKLVSIVVVLALVFFTRNLVFPKRFLGIIAFLIIKLAADLLNGSEFTIPLNCIAFIIVLINYFNYLRVKGKTRVLLDALAYISYLYIFLQIISVLYVNISGNYIFGKYDYYFLGTDNYSAFFVIPMLSIILLRERIYKRTYRIRNFALALSVFLCYAYTNSVTAMFATFIFFALYCGSYFSKKISNIKPIVVIIFSVLFLLLTIGVSIQNAFPSVFSGLNKDVTFDYRTNYWNAGLDMFSKSPMFGWGSIYNEKYVDYLGIPGHAHNMILELLFSAGIVGTMLYLVNILALTKVGQKDIRYNVLNIGLIASFVLGLMDFYPEMVAFYVLIYFIDNEYEIVKEYNKQVVKRKGISENCQ